MTERFPARSPWPTRRARPTSRVQIDPASPYSVALASRTASASSSKGSTTATGPKTSSTATGASGDTPARTVGGYQNPGPSGAEPRIVRTPSGRPPSPRPSTKPRTRSRWTAEISGPIPVFSSDGSPTTTAATAGASSSRKRSWTGRSTRMRVRAQQSWPALSRKDIGAAAAAASRSASAKTTFGLLPPSSRVRRFTRAAQRVMMCLPVLVDPVKTILATPGWSTRAPPATGPSPGSTWNSPPGSPASRASSARRSAVRGVVSAGLSRTALPAASAGAAPQAAIGIGKFQGAITPTTPRGSRIVKSMPPATGICRPSRRSTPPAQ